MKTVCSSIPYRMRSKSRRKHMRSVCCFFTFLTQRLFARNPSCKSRSLFGGRILFDFYGGAKLHIFVNGALSFPQETLLGETQLLLDGKQSNQEYGGIIYLRLSVCSQSVPSNLGCFRNRMQVSEIPS